MSKTLFAVGLLVAFLVGYYFSTKISNSALGKIIKPSL